MGVIRDRNLVTKHFPGVFAGNLQHAHREALVSEPAVVTLSQLSLP